MCEARTWFMASEPKQQRSIMNNQDLHNEFADWITSWGNRLENAYNAGVDNEGWPRFLEAMKYYNEHDHFRPGQIEYFVNRDARLGLGKLQNYNTYKGLNRRLGSILPAPVKAIILSGNIDWTIGGVVTQAFARRLEAVEPGWQFNAKSGCWQGRAQSPTKPVVFELFA